MIKYSKDIFLLTLITLVGAIIVSSYIGYKMEKYFPVMEDSQERLESLERSIGKTGVELSKEHFKLFFDDQRKIYEANLELFKLTVLWFKRLALVFLFCILALIFVGYVHKNQYKDAP